MAAAPAAPLILQGGRYEAVLQEGQPRFLGGGAFASVYQYRDMQRHNTPVVAIKRISLTNLTPLEARQLLRLLPRE